MKLSKNLILLGFAVSFLLVGSTFAGDRHVVGGSGGPYHYATIQAAVDAASAGETIYIYDSESIYLDIYGVDVYAEEVVVGVNDLTFEGVGSVTISQPAKAAGVGFDVSGTDGVSFTNLTIADFTTAGIFASAATNLVISSVDFNNNGMGVDLGAGSTFDISGCMFNSDGVLVVGDGNIAADFADCPTAVNMTGNGDITGTFNGGSAGVVLTGNGDITGTFSGGLGTAIVVNGVCNVFSSSVSGYMAGIDVIGGTVNVYDNEITGNSAVGIVVSGDAAGMIYDNNVYDNGVGIDVMIQATGLIRLTNNCITGNTTEATDANTWGSAMVRWFASGPGPGNYYRDYDGSGTYYLPGNDGTQRDIMPLAGSNNPSTAKTDVALGEALTIDFTYTSPGICSEYPFLKTCNFMVTWTNPDLLAFDWSGPGDYLPNVQFAPDDGVGYAEFSLSAAGDGNHATDFSGWLASLGLVAASDAIGTSVLTIGSEYLDKDGVPIAVTSTSLTINVKDLVNPEIVDEYRGGTFLSGSPEGNTFSDTYPVILNWEVEDDYDLWVFHARIWDATCTDTYDTTTGATGGGWYAIKSWGGPLLTSDNGTTTINVGNLPDGDYQLVLWLRDASSNADLWDCAKGSAIPFSVDNTAPDVPAFTLEDDDLCAETGWLGPGTVIKILSTTSETVPTMWFSFGDGGVATPAGAYEADYDLDMLTSPYTYSDDGFVDVYMQVSDVYGNWSGWSAKHQIQWSNVAPDETLFGFDAKAVGTDPNRTNGLSLLGHVDQWGGEGSFVYAYSIDDGGAALTCDNINTPKIMPVPTDLIPITLLDQADGNQEVFLAVADKAGCVSGIVSSIVELDRTAPVITVFNMYNNTFPDQECERDKFIGYKVEWTGDAKKIKVSLDGGSSHTGWKTVTTSPYIGVIDLTADWGLAQGTYDFTCQIKDALGNPGTPAGDDIFIDRTVVVTASMEMSDLDGSSPLINWTDDRTVLITLSGYSADIDSVRIDEVDGMTGAWQVFDAGLGTIQYTITGPACDYTAPVFLQAKDCAGRLGPVVSDNIVVDETDPVINVFEINDDDAVTKSVDVALTISTTEDCHTMTAPYQMMISMDPTFTDPNLGDVDPNWVAFSASIPSFLMYDTPPLVDDNYCIYVKVRDKSGREAGANDCIDLDRTLPTGTVTIVAPTPKSGGCPGAMPGYTCTGYDNTITFEGVDDDVTHIKIHNCADAAPLWAEFDPETAEMTWDELKNPGTDGTKNVCVRFKDDAGNRTPSGDPIVASIILDTDPPSWSGETITAFPTTGGDKAGSGYDALIEVAWDAHPQAQHYGLRYDWMQDYPAYIQPPPAFPPTMEMGLGGDGNIPTNSTTWETPGEPGIYYLSIFARDQAGNWGNALTVISQDYIGGDWGNGHDGDPYGPSGDIDLIEWNTLGNAFYSSTGDDNFNDSCDIAPTSNGWIDGYTTHDGEVDYPEMIIFTYNYDLYAVGAKGMRVPTGMGKPVIGGGLIVSAEVPRTFEAGDEFTAVISVSDPEAIKCLSFDLNYDQQLLEAVSIEPGNMFSKREAFLLNQIDGSTINLDGTILGADSRFEESEVALLHFRAKASGNFEFKEPFLDVRDGGNNHLDVEFKNVFGSPAVPTAFSLAQNYPNPFNPVTNIDFSIPHACNWKVEIFNIAGQLVRSFSGFDEPGKVAIIWDGTDATNSSVASGIYFYRAKADDGGFSETKKMVLMK